MNKQEIIDNLKIAICSVKFKKVDGTERDMTCTLHESILPPPKETSSSTKKNRGLTESNDHIVVWDTEKSAWRSFRIDSIIKFETVREIVESK